MNNTTMLLSIIDNMRHCDAVNIFIARDSIMCYSAYMLLPVRVSVCVSVRHTGRSVINV